MAKIIDPDDLTYIVDGTPVAQHLRFDTANKTIQLVADETTLFAKDGVTGQCLFSKIKEVIKADANLIKYALPVKEMIHDESMELINGWTCADATTLKMIRDCGLACVNAAGAITAMFACIVTLGEVISGAPYFVQSSATDATTGSFTHVNTGTTFGVNELVQIYRDDDGDGNTGEGSDYDYRSYLKVFLREYAKTYDEATNTDIGYPVLTYKKYNFPVTHAVDPGVTADDTAVDAYTGMSITWYNAAQSVSGQTGGPYDYHVIINGNSHTYPEIYSWVQRQLRKTTDIDADGTNVRKGNVTPALVYMDGTTLKTKYQNTNDSYEGGIHISNPSGASLNNIKEYDDTNALRSYPYTASITFEFDSYLVADGATSDAKFWIYDAATYPGSGATLLQDASSNDMTGVVTGASITFTYSYSADKAWKGVAVGTDGAKIAEASGTIIESTTNKGVFVAGLERWYSNPA